MLFQAYENDVVKLDKCVEVDGTKCPTPTKMPTDATIVSSANPAEVGIDAPLANPAVAPCDA